MFRALTRRESYSQDSVKYLPAPVWKSYIYIYVYGIYQKLLSEATDSNIISAAGGLLSLLQNHLIVSDEDLLLTSSSLTETHCFFWLHKKSVHNSTKSKTRRF